MNAELKPVTRTDLRERFREMVQSEPFRLVMERVEAELRRAVDLCARADEERELRRAQGAAAALRMVLGIPERLLAEMKQRSK